jgi:phenylalanyl-tRNA synthetase beta chain
MDGSTVAQFGQVHPEVAAARKLRQDVFLAEIYLDRLYVHGLREVRYQALAKYPAVERDFSFVFGDGVLFEKIRHSVMELGLKELREFRPVEIFRGGAVPPGKYSILLRATFQAEDRTLREEEVARWSAEIVKAVEGVGGVLRQ